MRIAKHTIYASLPVETRFLTHCSYCKISSDGERWNIWAFERENIAKLFQMSLALEQNSTTHVSHCIWKEFLTNSKV